MTDVAVSLRELAGDPLHPIKAAIARAAQAAGFDYWRAFDIWYGKARRIEDYEKAAVAAALDRKRREAARNELQELRTRLLRLESLMVQSDPDFHRPGLDANREHLRALGGAGSAADRAGDRGRRR